MRFLRRIHSLLRRRRLEAEMAEEMRLHLELQTERNRAAGMSETEARFAARRQFGGIEQIKERCRDQRGWRWLEEGWADSRFAGRMLRKHPGFTIAAVLTLALGIGFVTTLFTMINGVISFAVKLRTQEFGVRMALGAERGAIARMVLGDGIRQVSAGLGIGVLLAAAAAAGMRALFQGVGRSGFDVWPHVAVVAVLATVGGVALLIPARRAARVDPMVALRSE